MDPRIWIVHFLRGTLGGAILAQRFLQLRERFVRRCGQEPGCHDSRPPLASFELRRGRDRSRREGNGFACRIHPGGILSRSEKHVARHRIVASGLEQQRELGGHE
jgi:hypothetical protein